MAIFTVDLPDDVYLGYTRSLMRSEKHRVTCSGGCTAGGARCSIGTKLFDKQVRTWNPVSEALAVAKWIDEN